MNERVILELPSELAERARAFAALKQWDNALDLIAVDQADDTRRLRADIYWESGNWDVAGQKSEELLGARYTDLIECPPGRFVCQFITEAHSLKRLQALSRRWPGLVLLLDFESRRIKGLAKARAGELEHGEVSY